MKLLQCYIDNIINTALIEDINYTDAAADNLIEMSRQYNLYRQNYCDCVYSKAAK